VLLRPVLIYTNIKRLPEKRQVAIDISGLERPQSFVDWVYNTCETTSCIEVKYVIE
jgi:hypothetical protein